MCVFIVEDNENLREAIRRYLELEGMQVFEFGVIADAQRELRATTPDVIILDVMLPDGDGFLFAKRLKQRVDIPIIFLTARTEESDRITGLELGADDYIVKPFSPKELVLRVQAVLRRTQSQALKKEETDKGSIRYDLNGEELSILSQEHRLMVNGTEVLLTAAEWNILLLLAENAPQVFSRSQILRSCLESIAQGSERTVDTHIKNIRQKLSAPSRQTWIETIREFGYRFNGKKTFTRDDEKSI